MNVPRARYAFSALAGMILLILPGVRLHAQAPADTSEDPQRKAARVYIDCSSCDLDYLRREVTFVNYVRDPSEADVHILITSQRAANGGNEYTFTFMGQQQFQGINDTLTFTTKRSDTDDNTRERMAGTFRLGLVRYAARTPVAEQILVSHTRPRAQEKVADKWDYWLFSISTNGMFNGEQAMQSAQYFGSISANRVTTGLKVSLSAGGSYYDNRYTYPVDDHDTTITSVRHSQNFSGSLIFSIDPHWSWGFFTSASGSTYSNTDYSASVSPALEYDIFPYTESTRRMLRITYKPTAAYYRYIDETIYDKTREVLYSEGLTVTLDEKEPWGSSSISLSGTHYLHDFSKYDVGVFGSVSLRLFEGLSFQIVGNYSRQHDQLALPKGDATEQDVLLQRRALESQYSYFGMVGFTYSFGSIFNNIVNPRFGSTGGGYSISISSGD